MHGNRDRFITTNKNPPENPPPSHKTIHAPLSLKISACSRVPEFSSHYQFISYEVYPPFSCQLVHSRHHPILGYSFHVLLPSHRVLFYEFIFSFTNTNQLSYSFLPHSINSSCSNHCTKVIYRYRSYYLSLSISLSLSLSLFLLTHYSFTSLHQSQVQQTCVCRPKVNGKISRAES